MKLNDFFTYIGQIEYNFDRLIFWTDDPCFEFKDFLDKNKKFKEFYHVAVFLRENNCDGITLSKAYDMYCKYCITNKLKPLIKKLFKDRCICLYHCVEKEKGVLTIRHMDETK